MDNVSLGTMGQLVSKYLLHRSDFMQVLDVGSMNVQVGEYDSYRKFFAGPGFRYVGMDIEPGPNVDLVVKEHYNWGINEEYDVVISGQALEHIKFPWLTMEQIAKAMKPGALHINIVPSEGPVHRFPVDCYRYHVDGMIALADWAGLDVLECSRREDSIWKNTVLVARKPGSIENGRYQEVS